MSLSDLIAHDNDLNNSFVFFSIEHFAFISIAVTGTLLIFMYADKIKEWKYEKVLRIVIASILIFLEFGYHTHNLLNSKFSIPLHVCSVAVIISIILLLSNSYKAFEYVFLLGVLGGYTALLVPDMSNYTYVNLRFYHFVVIHLLIIVIPLYYYKAHKYRITAQSVRKSFRLLLAMSPLAIYINYTMDRNYMFIGSQPDVLADYLPPWPYYIIIFAIAIIVLFYSMYFISNFKFRRLELKMKSTHSVK